MNSHGFVEDTRKRVEAALESCGTVVRAERDLWELTVQGTEDSVSVGRAGEWLTFEALGGEVMSEAADRHLLELNWDSCGTARYAGRRAGRPTLKAEAPLVADTDLPRWVQTNLAGFSSLLARGQSLVCSAEGPAVEPQPTEDVTVEELSDRLRQAGWAPFETTESELAVELEVEGLIRRAHFGPGPGGVQARTDLLQGAANSAISEQSQQALALFLLDSNAHFRMVRGCARNGQERGPVWAAAVGFAGLPTAEELNHGLAALSVVCRQVHREVEALLDPRLAADYLALRKKEIECPT